MIFSNISSIDPAKGILEYIEAVDLAKKREGVKFEIVGKASDVNRDYERAVREEIRRRGLGDIVIMRGFVNDIVAYLDGVDVVVLSSTAEEALGMVLVEGMARGKAVIATDVGGVKEIVPVGYGNVLVAPGDVRQMAEAFEKMMEYDVETLMGIGYKNCEQAYRKFRLKNQVEKIAKLYKEIAKQ